MAAICIHQTYHQHDYPLTTFTESIIDLCMDVNVYLSTALKYKLSSPCECMRELDEVQPWFNEEICCVLCPGMLIKPGANFKVGNYTAGWRGGTRGFRGGEGGQVRFLIQSILRDL